MKKIKYYLEYALTLLGRISYDPDLSKYEKEAMKLQAEIEIFMKKLNI